MFDIGEKSKENVKTSLQVTLFQIKFDYTVFMTLCLEDITTLIARTKEN